MLVEMYRRMLCDESDQQQKWSFEHILINECRFLLAIKDIFVNANKKLTISNYRIVLRFFFSLENVRSCISHIKDNEEMLFSQNFTVFMYKQS